VKKLGNMLGPAVAREEVLRAAKAQQILKDWESVVGVALAKRSHPDRYDHGTVWVAVESSTWAQELRMRKDTILGRLGGKAGDPGLFQDVRFGVRPIKREEPILNEPLDDEAHKESLRGLTIREIAARRLKAMEEGKE
jgi:predicted nucleic acid-binding Zn ribbon protein